MSAFATPIELFNAALLRTGEQPTAEHEDSGEAMLFRASYEVIVRSALCKHKWSFAQKVEPLVKQGPSGDRPAIVYTAPTGMILLHKVTCGGSLVEDIELRGGKILSNRDGDLLAHFTHRAGEHLWTDDFVEAIVIRMEAAIRRLHEDYDTAESRDDKADELMVEALTRDRNSQASPLVSPNSPLVDAWRGARRRA